MAYRQNRKPLLSLSEIDANRLAIRQDQSSAHFLAIEAAAHIAALARQSANLMQFVKGV